MTKCFDKLKLTDSKILSFGTKLKKLLLRGEPDYSQDQPEKRLNQKLFQEVDPQRKQMILSRADQKLFDKMLEIAEEITDDLDSKKDNVE